MSSAEIFTRHANVKAESSSNFRSAMQGFPSGFENKGSRDLLMWRQGS